MGYYCKVNFVLEHKDAEDLLISFREAFHENLTEYFPMELGMTFEHEKTDYWYFCFKDVKWFSENPRARFVENFIKRCSYYELIVIGEDGAYEVFRSEDENQQYLIEPHVSVLRNWHDANLEFNQNEEDM